MVGIAKDPLLSIHGAGASQRTQTPSLQDNLVDHRTGKPIDTNQPQYTPEQRAQMDTVLAEKAMSGDLKHYSDRELAELAAAKEAANEKMGIIDAHRDKIWGNHDPKNTVAARHEQYVKWVWEPGGNADNAAGQTAANGTPNNLNPLATPKQEAAALAAQITPLMVSMPVGPQTMQVEENISAAIRYGNLESLRGILPTMAAWQKAPLAGVEDINCLASEIHPPPVYGEAGKNMNQFMEHKAEQAQAANLNLKAYA